MKDDFDILTRRNLIITVVLGLVLGILLQANIKAKKNNAIITVDKKPIAKIIHLNIVSGGLFNSDKTLLELSDSSFINLWGSHSFSGQGTYYIATARYPSGSEQKGLCTKTNITTMKDFNKCPLILGGDSINEQ